MPKQLTIYTDGGARGNPGPAAAAFLVLDEKGALLKSGAQFLGVRTNNQAEYEALIAALKFAVTQNPESIVCYLDSELVGRQLKKEYRVKNPQLQQLYLVAEKLLQNFKKVSIVNVPRTNGFIQRADALVNQALDKETF